MINAVIDKYGRYAERCDHSQNLAVDSELKRRTKAREAEAKKQAKAAAAPATNSNAPKKVEVSAKDTEDELSPSQYYTLRSKKILALRESLSPNPYPHKFHVTQSIPSFIEEFGKEGVVGNGEKKVLEEGKMISLAGRLGNVRESGPKLRFLDLHGEGVKVQILAQFQ